MTLTGLHSEQGFWNSKGTGNIFALTRVLPSGKLILDRIGIMRDGDFEENDGIPAATSPEWLRSAERNGAFIPMVRLMGGNFMPQDDYHGEREAAL